MAATTPATVETLPSIDPATGCVRGQFERTPALLVPELVAKARAVQSTWSRIAVKDRCRYIGVLKEKILAAQEELTAAVVSESGKPRVEAKFADIFVTLDTADYFAKKGLSLLLYFLHFLGKNGTIYEK